MTCTCYCHQCSTIPLSGQPANSKAPIAIFHSRETLGKRAAQVRNAITKARWGPHLSHTDSPDPPRRPSSTANSIPWAGFSGLLGTEPIFTWPFPHSPHACTTLRGVVAHLVGSGPVWSLANMPDAVGGNLGVRRDLINSQSLSRYYRVQTCSQVYVYGTSTYVRTRK